MPDFARYAIGHIEGIYSLQTLLFLLENSTDDRPIYITLLTKELGASFATIKDRTDDLEAAGLLAKAEEGEKPFRLYLSLTALGTEVASRIREAEDLLEGHYQKVAEEAV